MYEMRGPQQGRQVDCGHGPSCYLAEIKALLQGKNKEVDRWVVATEFFGMILSDIIDHACELSDKISKVI